MIDDHPLVDVWEDISRAPIATEVTQGEAADLVAANAKRYVMCSSCGVEVNVGE